MIDTRDTLSMTSLPGVALAGVDWHVQPRANPGDRRDDRHRGRHGAAGKAFDTLPDR